MKNKLIIYIFILSGILGLITSVLFHQDSSSHKNSSDTQMIETFHYPALFVSQLKGDKNAGEKIFKEFCSTCHAKTPRIDIHAPRIGDTKAWAALKKAGMSTLLNITISGAGAMPARGGCFECSDQQLRETIDYMLNQK